MENLKNSFKSKRVWTIIALVVINGIPSVRDFLPQSALPFIDSLLLVLGVIFGTKPLAKN